VDNRQHLLDAILSSRQSDLVTYQKRAEEKEKGHNHPFKEKCGPHCPRNENYKGPVKKFDFFHKRKQ